MSVALSDLINPRSADEWKSLLLGMLQGVGLVSQIGLGGGSVSVSGIPLASYRVILTIETTGELGTAAFSYTLIDTSGGQQTSYVFVLPATGTWALNDLVDTGVNLTFTPGTDGDSFVAGDTYEFSLTTPSFPVTAWQEGGVARTLVEIFAAALADADSTVAAVAAGGLLDFVTGIGLAADDWLDLLGEGFYSLTRSPAISTIGNIELTAASGAGPFTIVPGQLWVSDASGHRYNNIEGGTLNDVSPLTLKFQAEKPGSGYNVGNDTITTLLTSLAGVTVTNPAGSGSWITIPGKDKETNAAYIKRCKERWPSLAAFTPPEDVYDLWAVSAPMTSGAANPVTRTKVFVDPDNPGQVDVYLAGAAGSITDSAVIADVQAYIDERVPLTTIAVVAGSSNHAVSVTANIYVKAAKMAAAQVAIPVALAAYINNLPIGGDSLSSGSGVSREKIIAAIAGVDGVADVTLSLPAGDVTLSNTEVATLTFTPTWFSV